MSSSTHSPRLCMESSKKKRAREKLQSDADTQGELEVAVRAKKRARVPEPALEAEHDLEQVEDSENSDMGSSASEPDHFGSSDSVVASESDEDDGPPSLPPLALHD